MFLKDRFKLTLVDLAGWSMRKLHQEKGLALSPTEVRLNDEVIWPGENDDLPMSLDTVFYKLRRFFGDCKIMVRLMLDPKLKSPPSVVEAWPIIDD